MDSSAGNNATIAVIFEPGGRPYIVLADNGKDFRGEHLQNPESVRFSSLNLT